jgi:hypothetical protein
VRDDEDRARITLQVLLEPQQRLEVEVVGRLVEHQQVGFLRQQPRQVRTHHPAARQLARRPIELLGLEAEPGEDLLGLGLDHVAVLLVEALVHVVVQASGCAASSDGRGPTPSPRASA